MKEIKQEIEICLDKINNFASEAQEILASLDVFEKQAYINIRFYNLAKKISDSKEPIEWSDLRLEAQRAISSTEPINNDLLNKYKAGNL